MGSIMGKRVYEEEIRKEVVKHPLAIYTKDGCGYCKLAKELLKEERIDYHECSLSKIERENPSEYQKYVNGLAFVTKRTYVPQVFICGNFIGGFTELKNLQENKKLKEELSRCTEG